MVRALWYQSWRNKSTLKPTNFYKKFYAAPNRSKLSSFKNFGVSFGSSFSSSSKDVFCRSLVSAVAEVPLKKSHQQDPLRPEKWLQIFLVLINYEVWLCAGFKIEMRYYKYRKRETQNLLKQNKKLGCDLPQERKYYYEKVYRLPPLSHHPLH